MRHRLAGRHLGRPTDHRLSLYRNLVTDLLRYERITTTEAKAKEIRPMAEKVITLGKRGDLHARRQAHRFVYDGKVVKKVFDDIAPRFASRAGGYTRITALEARKGDGARMAMIELIDYVEAPPTPRPQRVTASPGVAQRPPASVTPPVVPPSVPEEMEPEDARVRATVEAVRETLWVRTGVGGIARYERDPLYSVGTELAEVPGSPSITATLWLANHAIRTARRTQELDPARTLLLWCAARTEGWSGLPEQLHPYRGETRSASPSMIAHAWLVATVVEYSERARLLRRCDRCGAPASSNRGKRGMALPDPLAPGLVAHAKG